ncbi:hypothetical protein MRB53_039430 [Persea americana]|nr:hypothetical protein MRB53_039430 [Persea americana]
MMSGQLHQHHPASVLCPRTAESLTMITAILAAPCDTSSEPLPKVRGRDPGIVAAAQRVFPRPPPACTRSTLRLFPAPAHSRSTSLQSCSVPPFRWGRHDPPTAFQISHHPSVSFLARNLSHYSFGLILIRMQTLSPPYSTGLARLCQDFALRPLILCQCMRLFLVMGCCPPRQAVSMSTTFAAHDAAYS